MPPPPRGRSSAGGLGLLLFSFYFGGAQARPAPLGTPALTRLGHLEISGLSLPRKFWLRERAVIGTAWGHPRRRAGGGRAGSGHSPRAASPAGFAWKSQAGAAGTAPLGPGRLSHSEAAAQNADVVSLRSAAPPASKMAAPLCRRARSPHGSARAGLPPGPPPTVRRGQDGSAEGFARPAGRHGPGAANRSWGPAAYSAQQVRPGAAVDAPSPRLGTPRAL